MSTPELPVQAQPDVEETTWSRLDPKMLLVHPVNELVRFLPLVVGVFVLGDSGGSAGWHLVSVAIPIALGLVRYASTTYRITASHVELRRGLLGRALLRTPLDRVRTVSLSSSLIHRALGLAKVQIGTGSASSSEHDRLVLDALSGDRAHALRAELLHHSSAAEHEAGHETGHETEHETEQTAATDRAADAAPGPWTPAADHAEAADEVLLRLDPSWVRYAPLTTSGLVIALGALAAGSQFIGPVLDRLARRYDVGERAASVPLPVAVLSAIVAALVVVSVLAVIGYLLTNYGFTLSRDRGGRSFHVRRGLLTTRETSIDRDRVRGVEVHEPLGLRLAGAGHLAAIVTGLSSRRTRSGTMMVPPAPRAVVASVGEQVLGDHRSDHRSDHRGDGGDRDVDPLRVALVPHGPAARRRRWTRALAAVVVVPAALALLALLTDLPWWPALLALLLLPVAAWVAHDRYAGLGHALTPRYLVVRSGSFRGRRDALQREGVIGWNLRSTLFQRRAGLVTLTATTAGGQQGYQALDIPLPVALALADSAVPGLLTPFLD